MNNKYVLIIDGLGIGKSDDSKSLKSEGANTLKLLNNTQCLKIENLKKLGIGLIKNVEGLGYEMFPIGQYGKAVSEIKTKNRFALIQEILQNDNKNIPIFNPVSAIPDSLIELFEKECNVSFLCKKCTTIVNAIKEYIEKQKRTENPILLTTGKSDLVYVIDSNKFSIDNNRENLKKIISLCRKSKYNFYEYYFVVYDNKNGKIALNKELSEHYFSPLENKWSDTGYFVGIDFQKSIIAKNIIKTKTDLETYRYVSDLINNKKLNNSYVFINFSQLYYRLATKKINGALNAINLIDLYIGEFLKHIDDTDNIIIIGTCGYDFNSKSCSTTKEAVPYIKYMPNIKSYNIGKIKLTEALRI